MEEKGALGLLARWVGANTGTSCGRWMVFTEQGELHRAFPKKITWSRTYVIFPLHFSEKLWVPKQQNSSFIEGNGEKGENNVLGFGVFLESWLLLEFYSVIWIFRNHPFKQSLIMLGNLMLGPLKQRLAKAWGTYVSWAFIPFIEHCSNIFFSLTGLFSLGEFELQI